MKSKEPTNSKPNFAYINFHTISEVKDNMYKLKKYAIFFDFLFLLKNDFNITVFDHIGKTTSFIHNDVKFEYIKKRFNFKWLFPWEAFLKLKKLNPEIIYVQGLTFPHFIIVMRLFLKPSTKILVHEHADICPKNWKTRIYKWADRYINTYFFTSKELAKPWLESKIISSENKIIECVEGSTHFNYDTSIQKEENSFLWVARLDKNKDPLTILNAFSEYMKFEPKAVLNMIYEKTTLLAEVKNFINIEAMNDNVNLIGALNHDDLEGWFQKSMFYILGSHKEGGSISLIEAMACGCIPIVTDIPASAKMIKYGASGFLFEPGNKNELIEKFRNLKKANLDKIRKEVITTLQQEMSHQAIALKIKNAIG